LDALLNDTDSNAEELHICTAEPAVYGDIATYSKGQKTALVINAPSDRGGGGREIVVPAISDGAVDGDGTVTHWAIVKVTATSRLLAAGLLSSGQAVTNGNTFTLTQFTIGVPDAV
jgi:hypothetical protein